MSKGKNPEKSKENFKITEEKQYQKKVKRIQVEKQTQLKEEKKPSKK
ncbi:MAG: hypothetical protein R2852_04260 [Bacteroidia bacterium]